MSIPLEALAVFKVCPGCDQPSVQPIFEPESEEYFFKCIDENCQVNEWDWEDMS